MIVFAIAVTALALFATFSIGFANMMRAVPGGFVGGGLVGLCWLIVAFFWLAWAFK